MLITKSKQVVVPSAIELKVFERKAGVPEGAPKEYWVSGLLGPLRISGVRVVESTFTNDAGDVKNTFNVFVPSKESNKLNPTTGKPYNNYFFRPTQEARDEFNKVMREAVRKFRGEVVRDEITTWIYSGQRLSKARVNSLRVNPAAIAEDADPMTVSYIGLGTFNYAGLEISNLFLKMRKPMIRQYVDGVAVLDEDGKPKLVPNVEREYTEEDGENPSYYLDFPKQDPSPQAIATAKAQGKYPPRYDWVSPVSKQVAVEMREDYLLLAMREAETMQ